MKRITNNDLVAGLFIALALAGLPMVGIVLGGKPIREYLEFPPLTQYVSHAGFSWLAFAGLAAAILAVILPFELRSLISRRRFAPFPSTLHPPPSTFPWWGWIGLVGGVAAWILAWKRFPWFEPLQRFTFSPLWFAYILVVNALTYRRAGRCMLKDRPRYLFALFLASAAFWWFFEYLNRFVQNWHYAGLGSMASWQYFVFATLPFSTVLPAVLGTCELLESFPSIGVGLDGFVQVKIRHLKTLGWSVLGASCVSLGLIGVFPDYLFPLLWISPLLIITSTQIVRGRSTLFSPVQFGSWRRLYLLAISALICGFFWEMWNYFSLAKWIYCVPFVERFKVFEMPILGYAGYLPFGLECAVIGDLVGDLVGAGGRNQSPSRLGWRKLAVSCVALLLAAFLWLPCLHFLFKPDVADYFSDGAIPPKAKAIASRHLELWSNPELRAIEIKKMRGSNAEWDFMARTFFVLSLANMGLREPEAKAQYLAIMDCIIDETIRLEKEHGIYYFLMDYARCGSFRSSKERSLFEDGEIALMLAARRMLEEKQEYKALLAERTTWMAEYMQESPVLSGESYPDECWTFCNTVALAAIHMADVLDGTDHASLIQSWLQTAKEKLTDKDTGMLISSYSFNGRPNDGPEGSTIWMVVHCLQILDRGFAENQYKLAKADFAGSVFGFSYGKEWADAWKGQKVADIDSGPIIPILDISAGSSGMAFLGAASFGDREYLSLLLTSLNFGAFPVESKGQRRYCASNQVGDAVLLYSMVQGPLWKAVEERQAKSLKVEGRGLKRIPATNN